MELVTGEPVIVVVGEGMVELSSAGRRASLGSGGDTLNAAIHLARLSLPTAFLTALGTDRFSDQLRADWAKEGLDTSLILTDPDRQPGIYAIHTDRHGERSFTYWRDRSAARRMFELQGIEEALERAGQARLLYFSLISLAILPSSGRDRLLALADRVRQRGGQVAFDGNYRPALWRNASEARRWRDAAIARCDIGLPSLEDERRLSGSRHAAEVAADWRSLGAAEVAVKMGDDGVFVDNRSIEPPTVLKPVDTTGAGDAFNAAYLSARLRGSNREEAAAFGHAVAGWVVMRRGAIPQIDAAAPYGAPPYDRTNSAWLN